MELDENIIQSIEIENDRPFHCDGCINSLRNITIKLGASTNSKDLGKSYVEIIARPGAHNRTLTQNEINACQKIFKNSIDYERVIILECLHATQRNSKNPAVITDGSYIYFAPKEAVRKNSPSAYAADFMRSATPNHDLVFMHEMTHVWQSQLGGITKSSRDYLWVYTPQNRGRFQDYKVEEQAEIVANYWNGLKMGFVTDKQKWAALILEKFLKDPSNKNYLPCSA